MFVSDFQTTPVIAGRLALSTLTVDSYLHAVRNHFRVRTRAQAVASMIEEGRLPASELLVAEAIAPPPPARP